MAVLLGCERLVECVNVMDPMAERWRAESTDADDTEDPESCCARKHLGCGTDKCRA